MAADAGDGEESVIVAHISFLDADSDGAGALGPVGYADRVLLTSFPVRLLGLLAVLSLSRCSCSVALVGPPADGTSAGSADVIAIAGPDLVVLEGTRVVLAGGASRALVGEPALSWVQSEGPAVVFSDPSSSSPAFISPLAPARLVFVLEAVAQSLRDTDTIVVDVVDHASLLVAEPATLVPVADRSVGVGDEVSIDERWTGRGDPVVVVRCASETLQGATVVDGRLTMRLRPLVLPCPIVIDDGGIPGAGRAAVTIWPATTVLGAASRADAPVSSDAGVDVAVEVDSETRVFFVDGRAITLLASAGGVRFRAPSSSGRLTLVAETRTGNTSGGLRVVPIVVGAGAGNSAPVIDGGADLRLRPGARFRIAPTVVDDNGDDVTVLVTQVLGDAALQVGGGVGVLQAPATAQTLLFHVVATDGVVDSAIDPVRVVVDPTAENRPPVLSIPTDLYVVPGGDFVVDASSARDPDTGLIASTRIAQDVGDAVLLLDGIIDAATVPLRAGAAGDVYRFVISAVDDEGLEASASLTVHVEEAGPFVDVVRGRADGVGTAARPFASIAAALDTAARHRFAQLRLATGGLGLEGVPDGLGLVGGYVFVDDDYVATDVATVVTLTDAVEIAGASLQRLVIGGATGELHLRRRVTLDDVSLSVPLAVLAGAHVDVNGGVLADVDLAAAVAEFNQVEIGAIHANASSVVVVGGSVGSVAGPAIATVGGALTTSNVQINSVSGVGSGVIVGAGTVASLGGSLDVVGASGVTVDGGTVDFVELDVHVHGVDLASGIVVGAGAVGGSVTVLVDDVSTGVGIASPAAPLGGTLAGLVTVVARTEAVGLSVFDGAFERLRLNVQAPVAVGVTGRRVEARAVVVRVSGVGVRVTSGELRHVTIVANDAAIDAADSVGLVVRNTAIRAAKAIVGVVDLGVVGLASDDGVSCVGCILAAPATIDAVTGVLASDADLGAVNAFVDAGAIDDAVGFDVDGRGVRGAGPDLGAVERE